MKKILLLTATITMLNLVIAPAQENTFYFMENLAQRNYYNPAHKPDYNITIGLPGISSNYISYNNSGFSYSDLIRRRAEDDSLELNLSTFYQNLGNKNNLTTTQQIDLFHLTFKVNPAIYLSTHLSSKTIANWMYPGDLVGFLVNGNAESIGETMELHSEIDASGYLEYGIGATIVVDRHLTLGARFKFLKGVADVSTRKSDFSISTNQDYHISLSGNADIRTSGLEQFTGDSFELNNFEDAMGLLANPGFAMDLGGTYQLDDKWEFGVSIIDLGFINWKNNTYQYLIDPATAKFTFRGVEIDQLLEGDEDVFDNMLDSLGNNFEMEEIAIGAYKSWLPTRFYLNSNYTITENLDAGLLLFGEKYSGGIKGGAGVNVTKEFGRLLSMSVNYSVRSRSYNNLGAGVSFNFSPLQLYLAGDNLLGAPLALLGSQELNPYLNNMKVFNFRFGINLIFNKEMKETKLPDDQIY